MMKNLLTLVLCIFLFPLYHLQTIKISPIKDKENIEAVISQEKEFANPNDLYRYLLPLKKSSDERHLLLYQVMLAEGLTKINDSIGPEEEKLYATAKYLAKKLNSEPLSAWVQMMYTFSLYTNLDYDGIVPELVKTETMVGQLEDRQVINPSETFKNIGWMMQTFQQHPKTVFYLNKAIYYTPDNHLEKASILDALGMSYFCLGNSTKAMAAYNAALGLAKKNKDNLRQAKVLGNMGQVYVKLNSLDKAQELYRKDIKISEKIGNHKNTMYASILLAKLLYNKKDTAQASLYIRKAEKISASKKSYASSELDIQKLKLMILQKQNLPRQELSTRRRIEYLERTVKDGENKVLGINWALQQQQYGKEISESNTKLKKITLRKQIITWVAVILVAVACYNTIEYYIVRRRTIKEGKLQEKKFQAEKSEYEDLIAKAKHTFHEQILYIQHTNKIIQDLQQKIDSKAKIPSSEDSHSDLQSLLNKHLMTEENWKNFRETFKKEHPSFFHTLTSEFPELTESNLRVILLQKLGFNNNEIAGLLGITPDAVKKSKQRLRIKLGSRYEHFTDIIISQDEHFS